MHAFSLASIDSLSFYKQDSVIIEELNYEDLKLLSTKYEYVWIHYFVPSCSNINAKDFEAMLDYEQKHNTKVKLVLLSATFDIAYISDLFTIYGRPLIVYVLNHADYSTNTAKAGKLFYHQIRTNSIDSTFNKSYYEDYLLKGGKLIYAKEWDKSSKQCMEDIANIME